MAGLVDIKFDERKLRRIEKQLGGFKGKLPRVMSRSINKTLTSARVQATNEITQKVNLKKTRAKRAMVLTKATFARWAGKIHFQKRRIRIIAFGARETKKGVTYKIRKTGGRKLIPGAFKATVRGGQRAENTGIFARKFRKGSRSERVDRWPIIQQRGPSMGSLFKENANIRGDVVEGAEKNLIKFIAAQVKLILEKR